MKKEQIGGAEKRQTGTPASQAHMQRVTCEMQAHIFPLPFLSSKISFVHIEAFAPMLESSCGGLRPRPH